MGVVISTYGCGNVSFNDAKRAECGVAERHGNEPFLQKRFVDRATIARSRLET
jgi:hypothetical protein